MGLKSIFRRLTGVSCVAEGLGEEILRRGPAEFGCSCPFETVMTTGEPEIQIQVHRPNIPGLGSWVKEVRVDGVVAQFSIRDLTHLLSIFYRKLEQDRRAAQRKTKAELHDTFCRKAKP